VGIVAFEGVWSRGTRGFVAVIRLWKTGLCVLDWRMGRREILERLMVLLLACLLPSSREGEVASRPGHWLVSAKAGQLHAFGFTFVVSFSPHATQYVVALLKRRLKRDPQPSIASPGSIVSPNNAR
jgi:hypothetical protein